MASCIDINSPDTWPFGMNTDNAVARGLLYGSDRNLLPEQLKPVSYGFANVLTRPTMAINPQ